MLWLRSGQVSLFNFQHQSLGIFPEASVQNIVEYILLLLKPDRSRKIDWLNQFGGKNGPVVGTKPLLASSILNQLVRYGTKHFLQTDWFHMACHGPTKLNFKIYISID
jgi:hypothetical protein